ncbi:MAG: hypothetical protein JWO78_1761 [Micavibrio sp.]|nr:hypothetical protein [Micavibrio sp.]
MTNTAEMPDVPPVQEQDSVNIKNQKFGKDEGIAITPIPDEVKLEIPYHPLGKPTHVWTYKDANGKVIFYNCRFITESGKEDRPLTYRRFVDGKEELCWKAVEPPRPLYGLDRLAAQPNAAVLLSEGEKATDAAQVLFPECVAITSPNGAASASKADWSPVAGRHITIWPDQDKAGKRYAENVTALARQAGAASITVVAVPEEYPDGWDLADTLPKGIGIGDLHRLKAEAKEPIIDVEENPLDSLVERCEIDPGEAFKPEILSALAELKKSDLSAYESLLSKLKNTKKVPIGEIRKTVDNIIKDEDSESGCDPNQTDILLGLAEGAELFHTPDGRAFADIEINGHRETHSVRSQSFKLWLIQRYYEVTDRAPNSESLNAVINTMQAKAHFTAPERDIFMRVGELDGKIYIDQADKDWTAIEVDKEGWRIVAIPPVRFRRAPGMLPMANPERGGSIDELRPFLNVDTNNDFVLVVAVLLAALRSRGPYPVTAVGGEQGAAKSTFTLFLKKIVDPNTSPLRTLPRDERDLHIAANNGHFLVFDNISGLPAWLADAYCRLSTGGGFATRQLNTDQDEILFQAMRPAALNGIEDIVTRPDLADRAVIFNLKAIAEMMRRPEKDLLEEFDAALPRILGALLNGLSHGLRELPNTHLEMLPRMADFALWGVACEGGFAWPAGTFINAYQANCDAKIDSVIESNSVASAIMSLMDGGIDWTGTHTELLEECGKEVPEGVRKSKYWPTSGRGLSNQLKRSATFLRKKGIEIVPSRGKDKKSSRLITISYRPVKPEDSSSETPEPSEPIVVVNTPDDIFFETDMEPLEGEILNFDERYDADVSDDTDANISPFSRGLMPL